MFYSTIDGLKYAGQSLKTTVFPVALHLILMCVYFHNITIINEKEK